MQCAVQAFTFSIPLLGEVAHHAHTPRAVASTYAALVELELGADDAVAAGPHAFPFHAHRAAVWTTLGPVYHLKTSSFKINTAFFSLSIKYTVPLKENVPSGRTPHSIRCLSLCRSACTHLSGGLPRTLAPTQQRSSPL